MYSNLKINGSAIISSLLVVFLSSVLVSGLLWRQQIQIRYIENQRLIMQARWIIRSSVNWSRLVLRSEADSSPGVTYLGGTWSTSIEKTNLSKFLSLKNNEKLTADQETYLSGSIIDAQAFFNVRNLVSSNIPGQFQINYDQVKIFEKILKLLNIDISLAKNTAIQLYSSLKYLNSHFKSLKVNLKNKKYLNSIKKNSKTLSNKSTNVPLLITSIDSLLNISGFNNDIVDKLRPFVTVLPTITKININTASAEIISSTCKNMNLAIGKVFVNKRKNMFFKNINDIYEVFNKLGIYCKKNDLNKFFDVNTNYFLVCGKIQHKRAEVNISALIWRYPKVNTTSIIWIHDRL